MGIFEIWGYLYINKIKLPGLTYYILNKMLTGKISMLANRCFTTSKVLSLLPNNEKLEYLKKL